MIKIDESQVYSTNEAKEYLKVSSSTITRLIKKGLIRAARVGKQYRIMGKEILRLISPQLEDQVGKLYNKGRRWVHSDDPTPKTSEEETPVSDSFPSQGDIPSA